jgi:hypothetical protein
MSSFITMPDDDDNNDDDDDDGNDNHQQQQHDYGDSDDISSIDEDESDVDSNAANAASINEEVAPEAATTCCSIQAEIVGEETMPESTSFAPFGEEIATEIVSEVAASIAAESVDDEPESVTIEDPLFEDNHDGASKDDEDKDESSIQAESSSDEVAPEPRDNDPPPFDEGHNAENQNEQFKADASSHVESSDEEAMQESATKESPSVDEVGDGVSQNENVEADATIQAESSNEEVVQDSTKRDTRQSDELDDGTSPNEDVEVKPSIQEESYGEEADNTENELASDSDVASDVETEIEAPTRAWNVSEKEPVSGDADISTPMQGATSDMTSTLPIESTVQAADGPKEDNNSIEDRSAVDSAAATPVIKNSVDEDPWSAHLTDDEAVAGTAPATSSVPIGETKGAQILMSRFSSWRKKANETVTQNVSAFSQSEIGQQLKNRANAAYEAAKIPPPGSAKKSAEEAKQPLEPEETEPGPVEQQHLERDPLVEKDDDAADSQDTAGASNEDAPANDAAHQQFESMLSDGDSLSKESISEGESDYYTTDYSESVSDASNLRGAAAALYVRTAASVVADSVATGFRGRYGENGDPPTSLPKTPITAKESQTAKIMGSRAAAHMQSILDTLDESHEYIMLLGHGLLGVNLRQTYLKNHGVYVDFLVEGGAAFNSAVVYAGDILQKIGNESVARGTILNVPKLIARSKRPCILVFSTGQKVEFSKKINYLHLVTAMMHQIKEEAESSGPFSKMQFHNESDEQVSGSPQSALRLQDQEWKIPPHPLDAINPANVPPPPLAAKEALKKHLAKRGNGDFTLSMMTNAAAKSGMDNFRTALHHAFVTCALDGRRLPFLSRHFATLNSTDEEEDHKDVGDAQKTNASVELMLFLELMAFVELYGATPKSRRRDITKRIAFKFFLPSKVGKRLEKPMFDFSHIVEHEELVALRSLLLEPEGSAYPPPIKRNAFLPFQVAIVEKLCGAPFISFLISDECARMRGYLRNTSPYRTVSPGDFFYHVVALQHDDHAANHFLYNLAFLLCQREREVCGENDDIVGEKSIRVTGAAGGICCAMFIKKTLIKIVHAAEDSLDNDAPLDSEVFQDLKRTYEQFWEMFVSPQGGALEVLSNSNETEDELGTVRKRLDAMLIEKDLTRRFEILTEMEMVRPLARLADNLVYDYSVNAYTKFREHPFHEWMCAEVSHAAEEDVHDANIRIPKLTHGSIARLLRRAELPNGVSPHKPSHGSEVANTEKEAQELKEKSEGATASIYSQPTTAPYPNAHHAIIFGTNDGSDAGDRGANPAVSDFDIRRYTCQEVWLNEGNCEPPSKLCRVQPNIESYSIVPALRKSPFSGITNSGRISADGWQVSLIDFMIPGAEAESSQAGATYGVSLVFQQDEITFFKTNGTARCTVAPLKLVYEEPDKILETPKANRKLTPKESTEEPPSTPFAGGGIAAMAAQAAAAKKKKAEEALEGASSTFAGGGIAAMAAQAAAAKKKKAAQAQESAAEVISAMAAETASNKDKELLGSADSEKRETVYDMATGDEIDVRAFASPLSIFSPEPKAGSAKDTNISRVLRVETNIPSFNKRLAGSSWIERVKKQRFSLPTRAPVTIGIVLVSSQNVIYAMRDTLSQLLSDFSKQSDDGNEDESRFRCQSLVELLGNFAHMDVEYESLRYILQPYLRFGSSPWLRQPLRSQAEEFELECGEKLLESLPLIPLALLYVTIFLEQKVVFSSSRRGILVSAVTAITKLLEPFKWEHLLVPLVPSSLARDLLEYPAPFIIGLASEDEGNLELLNSLPDDVTLVDLDVGRVILAPVISYDDRYSSSGRHRATAPALRSQVLYLAQALGLVFGTKLRSQTWSGDSPGVSLAKKDQQDKTSSFVKLQATCKSFLMEVLAGTESCSYWMEEHRPADMSSVNTDVDRTILFDEDRFFQIKNLRALRKYTPLFEDSPGVGELALSLDDFDLVLECFLQCQSMSNYISTRPKTSMAFF